MPLPSFSVTGTLNHIVGDVVGGELSSTALPYACVVFTPNVAANEFVTWEGELYRVEPVTAVADATGSLNGDIFLLANDAGLNVDNLQWKATLRINSVALKSWWFDAPADGETVDLADVAPSPAMDVTGPTVSVVIVSTGTEERPAATVVFWVDTRPGGASAPTNMTATDIWFATIVDLEAPTVPEGLAASAITDDAFTVSWTASTDNVAVTGYEVRLDGGTAVALSTLTHTFTGLTATTDYDVDVRARDGSANWSDWSTPITVTTLAGAPDPFVNFDFHEGSGSTTTSTVSAHTMTALDSATGWVGVGEIKGRFTGDLNPPSETITEWTLLFNIKMVALPGSEESIIAFSSGRFVNVTNTGVIKLYGDGATLSTSAGAVATGTYHKYVLVYSTSGRKLFLDGTEILGDANTGSLTTNTAGVSPLYNGASVDMRCNSYKAWKVALSDANVAAL